MVTAGGIASETVLAATDEVTVVTIPGNAAQATMTLGSTKVGELIAALSTLPEGAIIGGFSPEWDAVCGNLLTLLIT